LKIWIDADACPGAVKEIVFRASQRLQMSVTLVANQYLPTPASALINAVQVPQGLDVADSYIVENLDAGDLVITADIPLAAQVIESKAHALNPRGELYTRESIRERLSIRNFMTDLRDSGVQTGGPKAFGQREKQAFGNALDRFLARHAPRK
jgi:hypothetical protein